jgi:hypothetical protein
MAHNTAAIAEATVDGAAFWAEAPRVQENYMSVVRASIAAGPRPELCVRASDVTVTVRLFAGHDWPAASAHESDASAAAAAAAAAGTEYVQATRPHGVRHTDRVLEIAVQRMGLVVDGFAPTEQLATRVELRIGRAVVRDQVAASNVNRLVAPLVASPPAVLRPTSDMLVLVVESVRPDMAMPTREELRMVIDVHPLRVFLHQRALELLLALGAYEPPVTVLAAHLPPEPESFIRMRRLCFEER